MPTNNYAYNAANNNVVGNPVTKALLDQLLNNALHIGLDDFTFGGDKVFSGVTVLQKILKTSRGADVASASTLAPGDDGNYFVVTGSTTITGISTKGGGGAGTVAPIVFLEFSGAPQLTHNGTSFILPSAQNFQAGAGNVLAFVEESAGNWRCISTNVLGNQNGIIGSGAGNTLRKMRLQLVTAAAGTGSGCTLSWTASGGVVNATPTVNAGGSGYVVGDVLTINGGTLLAQVRVATLSGSAVASVAFIYGGTGYGASGTGTATTQKPKTTAQSVQTSGQSFNISAQQDSTVTGTFYSGSGGNGNPTITAGAGGTAWTAAFHFNTDPNTVTITNTGSGETISNVLSASIAQTAFSDNGTGAMITPFAQTSGSGFSLQVFDTAAQGRVLPTMLSTVGTHIFDIVYVVGGAA